MIYISKKEISKIRRRGYKGDKNHEFKVLFDHALPARLWTDFDPTNGIR